MSMPLPDPAALVDGLEAAGVRLVIAATGGGSEAVSHLVGVPGASGVVLEGAVPYARVAIDDWLGGPQETYCSSRAARLLAMAAWQRARAFTARESVTDVPMGLTFGAAVTAALRTRRPKRGDHRIFAAVQSLAATRVAELVLEKGARSRAEEERIAAALVLALLAAEAGLDPQRGEDVSLAARLRPGERVEHHRFEPPAAWQELLAGTRRAVAADGADVVPGPGGLVFPGSFHPLHEGHRRMAVIAEEIAERPVDFELSILNVDKPPLDYVEMAERAAQFTAAEGGAAPRRLWLTRAATFLEKLDVFPESTFVMGADTYARLGARRYYGGSSDAARQAVRRIARRSRGLIVFGRERDGVFVDAAQLDVPRGLREVTYFVSPREFRVDVSSTELRRAARDDAEAT